VWTHRRYMWRWTPPTPADAEVFGDQARAVLQVALDEFPVNYSAAVVRGMAFGVLEFAIVISDRDQWWVGRRARLLVEELAKGTEIPLELVSVDKVKLEPHMHRGRRWLRAQERESGHGG
jgi:hypothetical protein